jgi:ABC-type polysaccharide/polyol phosphate transport system ATPase subunit
MSEFSKQKEMILEVDNFTVSYKATTFQSISLRDQFVNLFKKPEELFFKNKDTLLILDNISFSVTKGEVVGLIGANGVGKTSLCRYLAGIIGSKQIKCRGAVRAIFDTNLSLYPNLTGLENTIILTRLMFPELSNTEREEIVKDAINFSELNEFIHMPLNRYSKGMKSRLYLSLVTSRPADLLILDEIFGATDIFFAQKLTDRMSKMIQESGAVIIVSHNMEDIRRYCNKLILLENKKVAFIGDVESGIQKYENN